MQLPLILLSFVCLILGAESSRTERLSWQPRTPKSAEDHPLPSTNAKRLELGLPLLPPRRATPRGSAPRAEPSPGTLITRTCNLKATVSGTTTLLGYVSQSVNNFGVYGNLLPSTTGALEVTFTYSGLAHTALNLLTTNGNSVYPYFGAVLAAPDNNYNMRSDNSVGAFVVGTPKTSAGPPGYVGSTDTTFGYAESAIWTYDSETQVLTPVFVSPDGTSPTLYNIWNPDDNTMNLFANPNIVNYSPRLRIITLTCVH
ncbi:hypothetical protein MVEN_01939500 [Mycena venus]|uniref:Uncharacterized protein n=1 Tax=Mycena venus TaxID=2733690 RepID=A0A8H7CJP6_9AGAR|nr:hypothetical protein MVEN_01939500 [Mycena venus]